jgi:MIP family channel proteins
MQTKPLIAELIGTFALIFIGAGAAALSKGDVVLVALAHGFVIVAFAYAYGHISGTHINPAVTFGLLIAKKIKITEAIGYWVAQLLGGIIAGLALAFALKGYAGAADSNLGATVLAEGISPVQGLVIETILTFFLVNTVLNAAVSGKAGNLAGLAIGLTLSLSILLAGPLTGASLNPARTLGPAVASGTYANIWLYFVGPLLGGLIAALLYIGVFEEKSQD